MLIRCPTCASGYDLASAMLTDGRILRCAHCRDAWVHRDEPAGGGPEIVAEVSAARVTAEGPTGRATSGPAIRSAFPRPTLRFPAHLRPPPGTAAAAFAALLLASGSAAVAGKAQLVAAFPPSEAVFATLGLPVNLSGLSLGDLRSTVAAGESPPTLTLEGRITNLRPASTPVPALRIAVRDKDRRELYHWIAPAPKARLAIGETILFRSRLTAPPRDGQDLAVSFAEAAPERRRVAEAMPSDR